MESGFYRVMMASNKQPSGQAQGLIPQWLDSASREHAGVAAFEYVGRSVSFGELAGRIERLCSRFWARGLRPGDVLVLQLGSPEPVYSLIGAAARLGIALFPLDPGMAEARRDRFLRLSGCTFLLSDHSSAGEGISLIDTTIFDEAAQALPDYPRSQAVSADTIQLIIATSGTTGAPKGVMLSAANLAASVIASRRRLGLEPGDRWLNCLPLFHIGGLSIFYRCLEAGATLLLQEGFDAQRVWRALKASGVTHISLVPPMLSRLLEVSGSDRPPRHLKRVLIGGGALSPELAARAHAAGWPICATYGMSETASQFATDCSAGAGLVAGVVGTPLDGFEVALSEGDQGVVRVRGPAVMAGYLTPGLIPGEGLDDGWFETGDYARLDAQGRLRIQGRVDDLLISAGKTIHPVEVEAQLSQAPGVEAVAVTSRPDPVWGDLLVALFVGELAPKALERWAREHMPSALRPREFQAVEALPTNAMGKLDRLRLRGMVEERSSV